MEELNSSQKVVLDAIDSELRKVEVKLKKAEPLIRRRDQLNAARRALLAERGVTSGAGSSRTKLSMEEVISALRACGGAGTVAEIAEHIPGVDPTAIRSHLNRHKDERYAKKGDKWRLMESDDEED
jgi:hypothetical protein